MKPSESKDVRGAIQRVLQQLDCPLVDTWGCSHAAHVLTIVERIGKVSTVAQKIASNSEMPGARRVCREDLVVQLAEFAVNVVAMLTDEMTALRSEDEAS